MNIFLYIVLIMCFIAIAYQDISRRLIHFTLPILILIIGTVLFWKKIDVSNAFKSLLFLCINFISITIYFSVKNRKIINPFEHLIGLGDLLFLIALIPFFSFRNYVIFFIFGMIFSLVMFFIFKSYYKNEKTVPLAGYLSIFITLLLMLNLITDKNIFFDYLF